jgi:general nucleoside transport system ATP-binding protein
LTPAIECRGIYKRFGAIRANDGIDLIVRQGEVHGIIGENGAGKSTLMELLYGHLRPDAGELRIHGRAVRFRSPRDAIAAGIGMVHQEFVLVEPFTVLENLLLAGVGGPLLRRAAERLREELARFGRDLDLALDPDAIAGGLPVGLRQRLEILKALLPGANILILDEPTAVLTPDESERLFLVLRRLAADGCTVLFVTHKLHEILAVTERVSVIRAGRIVATLDTATTDVETLGELMIGRRLHSRGRPDRATSGAPMLEATGLAAGVANGGSLRDIGFQVHQGEIVGIAGVAGNGQSELMAALAGLIPMRGSLKIAGREAGHLGVAARRALGLALIPEDRRGLGLVAEFTAAENAILGDHHCPPFAHRGFAVPTAIADAAARHMRDYDIHPADPNAPAISFSGGNQQKLLCAREIARHPPCLVVGEPTRGIDIGAADFIHRRLLALKAAGAAILLVSSDLDEIRTLSDHVLVIEGGRIAGALGPDASPRAFGLMMGGGPRSGIDIRAWRE